MARLEHLRLVRLPERFERRKRHGFSKTTERAPGNHAAKLSSELDVAVAKQKQRRRPTVDPSLILRVKLSSAIPDNEWEKLGLTVLSVDGDRSLVLFSSSDELTEFRRRIQAYGAPIPDGQKKPQFTSFVSAIDAIGAIEPQDRIGPGLRAAGYTEIGSFTDEPLLLDLELWEVGDHGTREVRLHKIKFVVEAAGGEVLDEYNGPSISALRIRINGSRIGELLSIEDVATIDLPPKPDLATGRLLDLTFSETPRVADFSDDLPVVGIVDSGVAAHPLLNGALVATIAEPEDMGAHDGYGHGTLVAGVATFGDLRAQLENETLIPVARIASARVLNDKGRFDDRSYVPKQMRKVITRLHSSCGCRIFVLSLGHADQVFDGQKVGPWAATLDELARQLDILILVAAGNRKTLGATAKEEWVTGYPHYLSDTEAAFCEPAGAMNVLTVGSLAHGPGLEATHQEDAKVRAITDYGQPSPFTRRGPGVMGAIKPDLVDFGGTCIFDAVVDEVRSGQHVAAAGMVSLHHKPVDKLFASSSGTSIATPFVAFKASQLLRKFPHASANLLRALLVGGAQIPDPAAELLARVSKDAARNVCGHGLIEVERSAFSDNNRVVLYTEDELSFDYFAVYEVPIPAEYQKEKGRREIRVTLAFDPPVRHRRKDYIGTTMSFRLVRGCKADFVFEHYRKRANSEGKHAKLPGCYDCKPSPGPDSRDQCTIQTGTATFERDISRYGDSYYVVVRCEAGWANLASAQDQKQRYALVVELRHAAPIRLYERVQVRQLVQPRA
jgi:hypothetical protein